MDDMAGINGLKNLVDILTNGNPEMLNKPKFGRFSIGDIIISVVIIGVLTIFAFAFISSTR